MTASRLRRLRGRLAAHLQDRTGTRLRRQLPLSAVAALIAATRRVAPDRVTDANPFRVVRVDPRTVERSILESAPKRPQWGRVQGGDWDRQGEPFAERPVPAAVRQHFVEGVAWERTPLRAHFRAQLERFGNAWGHTSMAGYGTYRDGIEQLYDTIASRGYRSQRELADAGDPGAVPVLDEINADIGRDGRLLWRGYGQHRLAIARVLDVEAVPVLLHRRHRGWQATRDRARTDPDSLDRDGSHPDLAAIVD
ncbi:MAG: hypothetical protein V5A55_09440 [Halovenus sp.]